MFLFDYIYNVTCDKYNVKEFIGKSSLEFVFDILKACYCGSEFQDKTRLVFSFRYLPKSPLYDLSDWVKKFNKSTKLTL